MYLVSASPLKLFVAVKLERTLSNGQVQHVSSVCITNKTICGSETRTNIVKWSGTTCI